MSWHISDKPHKNLNVWEKAVELSIPLSLYKENFEGYIMKKGNRIGGKNEKPKYK